MPKTKTRTPAMAPTIFLLTGGLLLSDEATTFAEGGGVAPESGIEPAAINAGVTF